MLCCVEVILPCLIFVKVTVVVNCVEIRSHLVVYRFTTILLWMECIHVFMVNVSYHIFKLTISGSSIFFFVIFLVLVFAKIKFYVFIDSDKL